MLETHSTILLLADYIYATREFDSAKNSSVVNFLNHYSNISIVFFD